MDTKTHIPLSIDISTEQARERLSQLKADIEDLTAATHEAAKAMQALKEAKDGLSEPVDIGALQRALDNARKAKGHRD